VALVDDQLTVTGAPTVVFVLEISTLTVGAGVFTTGGGTGAGTGDEPPPPPPQAAKNNANPVTKNRVFMVKYPFLLRYWDFNTILIKSQQLVCCIFTTDLIFLHKHQQINICMLPTDQYVCAVGDSFVFGAELVTTYYPHEFKHLTQHEYSGLEFEISMVPDAQQRYNELLDSMRFSNLLANKLGALHSNYAQGGASQEGIKLQTYLLLDSLKKKNVNLANTTWLIGITAPTRKMHHIDEESAWHDIKSKAWGDENYVWSRTTSGTVFMDRVEQNTSNFSPQDMKSIIANTPMSQLLLSWAMDLSDIRNTLLAHGVQNMYFLNMFTPMSETMKEIKHLPIYALILRLLSDLNIFPAADVQMAKLLRECGTLDCFCDHGHFNLPGNITIAEQLFLAITSPS
jgi:hypothetical protein